MAGGRYFYLTRCWKFVGERRGRCAPAQAHVRRNGGWVRWAERPSSSSRRRRGASHQPATNQNGGGGECEPGPYTTDTNPSMAGAGLRGAESGYGIAFTF